jgi:hypothetical protein
MFTRLVKKAGIPLICVHDRRHTCTSMMLSDGEPSTMVPALLRHRSPATTAIIYACGLPGAGAEARTRTLFTHIRALPCSTQRHPTPAPVIQSRQAGHMPVADDLQRSPCLLSANLAGSASAARLEPIRITQRHARRSCHRRKGFSFSDRL